MIKSVAALAVAAAVLAGCASTVSGRGAGVAVSTSPRSSFPSAPPSSTSSSSGPGSSLGVPATSAWQRNSDSATGISFLLPGIATAKDQSVATASGSIPGVLYTIQTGPETSGVNIGITIIGTNASPASIDPDAYAQGFKKEFTQAGSTDAQILELKHLTYSGHQALDFRFSFTALDAPHPKAVWFIRMINDGGKFVVAQTITFSTNPDSVLPQARALQAFLVSHITLA